jgi:hypothetical protein
MKKYLFFITMFAVLSLDLSAKEPPKTTKTEQAATPEIGLPQAALAEALADSTSIPDSICILVNGQNVCLPIKDTAKAGEILKEFIEGQKGNWPKDLWGILVLIVGFLLSGKGTMFLSNATKVYKFLKIFLRETLNVVIFIAVAFSASLTLLVGFLSGKGFAFDWQIFSVLSPMVALLAIYIYERKKKKDSKNLPQ